MCDALETIDISTAEKKGFQGKRGISPFPLLKQESHIPLRKGDTAPKALRLFYAGLQSRGRAIRGKHRFSHGKIPPSF